jgi:hypothetical protein
MIAASYFALALGQVSGIVGATLISSAWAGEAPKKSAVAAGVAFAGLGAVLSVLGSRTLRDAG